MGIIPTLICVALALALAENSLSCAYRNLAARWGFLPRWSNRVPDAGWLLPELSGSGCLAALAFLGVHPVLLAVAAGMLFAAAILPLSSITLQAARQGKAGYVLRRIGRRLILLIRSAPTFPAEDMRAVRALFRRDAEPGQPQDRPVKAAAKPDGGTRRAIPVPPHAPADMGDRPAPPVREDPDLGDPGHPADIAQGLSESGVAVPPVWASLADAIGGFEPDTEDDLFEALAGDAAGALAVADAMLARGETLFSVTGLDPAYIAGHADLAEEFAGFAQAVALIDRRYHVIYGTLREAIADGMILPHKARQFFGADGTTPAPHSGEAAA